MIDNGQLPLASVDAFGNFWHGYRTFSNTYRDRAGAVMPNFPAWIPNLTNADAHLVDFGMPTVTTPAEESAKGMERWNKAILTGRYKRYAINKLKEFGIDGWPYRCPDGTVYFLRAVCTFNNPNVLQVKAIKLDDLFTLPTAVVASIQVPTVTGVDTLNFAPNGSKAAAHSYVDYSNAAPGNLSINWICEATISGGSVSTAPSVSLTLSYTSATSTTQISGDSELEYLNYMGWGTPEITYTTFGQFNETRKITTTWPVLLTATTGTQYPKLKDQVIERIIMVVYGADGGRHVLSSGAGNEICEDYWISNFVAYRPSIEYDDGAPNAPYIVQQATYAYDKIGTNRKIRRLSRDLIPVTLLESMLVVTRHVELVPIANSSGYDWVETITPLASGNAIGPWGDCLSNSAIMITAAAANVLALIENTTTWSLIGYVSASNDSQYAYDAKISLPGNLYPAINPVNGAFDPAISHYF